MAHLGFYAAPDDWPAVLETVFALDLFRVFEAGSRPGHDLREFTTVPSGTAGRHLLLLVRGAGPAPVTAPCEGWGLIQLSYGGPCGTGELRWSHTSHNTAERASVWARTIDRLGEPDAWDWSAVASASGRLNRVVRRPAVDKIGPRPVLPHAARLIAERKLRYEYGTGVHATPSPGMVRSDVRDA